MKEVKQFIGMAGYYRMFMQDFLKIVTPMTKLTRKGVKFVWTDKCAEVFEELKTTPILKLPTGTVGMVIYSDASM